MKSLLSALCCVWFLVGCQSQQHKSKPIDNIARAFVSAYNDHDIDLMMSMVHPDMRYMFINNEKIYTETDSKKVLQNYLVDFFNSKPKAQSDVISSLRHGPFIQQVEQAIVTNQQGNRRTQCSLSIYELKDDLIINVWYFDVFSCPENP